MSTVDKCHAAYLQCLGAHPTQLQQIQCTFKYAQCILGVGQAMLEKQMKSSGKKKPKTTHK